MKKLALATLIFLILGASPNLTAQAQVGPQTHCEATGTQSSGALYQICMPLFVANGALVVYAHGYVSPYNALAIPSEAETVALYLNSQGYAFASTSFSVNGLAVLPGLADILDLVNIYSTTKSVPNKIYIIGASEGGLLSTLAVERHPEVFSGGLAMCAPYGDFRDQINHVGDTRIVFDYFFPGILPGSPISVTDEVRANWTAQYEPAISQAMRAAENADETRQLLNVMHMSTSDMDEAVSTVTNVLWYNVFGTNDARAKLGGQPYDNQSRVYTGSDNDTALNQGVARFSDEAATASAIAQHQTTGRLTRPLVTLHTTRDPIVLYEQFGRYFGKILAADNIALQKHTAIARYGHCSFTQEETIAAFDQLTAMVASPPAYRAVSRLYLPLAMK